MNCLWLLILLCFSRNRSGLSTNQNCGCGNTNNDCARSGDSGRSSDCDRSSDCERRFDRDFDRRRDNDCDCDRRRDRDNDCDCERRSFISFGNQTCGCEGNQN